MKLKLSTVIKDLDDCPIIFTEDERTKTGKPVYEKDGKTSKTIEKKMMLIDACIGALMTPLKQDENMTGDKKLALFSLAMQLKKGNGTITVEEANLIKERIGFRYPPLIVGRVYGMIEGE